MDKAKIGYIAAQQDGFVLVIALLFLFILSIIGISASKVSLDEVQISGNDKLYRQAFAQSDGGTEAGIILLEENISCPTGFHGPAPLRIGLAEVTIDKFVPPESKLNFWINETIVPVSDTDRHIRFPYNVANDALPHTNLYFSSESSLSTGNALQMISGYEGIGFSAAQGGGQLNAFIDSQHIGVGKSQSGVRLAWRHVIGHEGTCNY